MQEIKVTKNEAGQRLDKLLAKYLNEAPKSFFYKMMRKKNIVLNGKKATGNEKLEEGDIVKLFLADETIRKFSSVKIQRTKTNLSVIYEDQDVVLINKPVGMLSQKAKESDVSLVEHLISYLLDAGELSEEFPSVNLQPARPQYKWNSRGREKPSGASENGRTFQRANSPQILSMSCAGSDPRRPISERMAEKG